MIYIAASAVTDRHTHTKRLSILIMHHLWQHAIAHRNLDLVLAADLVLGTVTERAVPGGLPLEL